MKAHSRVGAGWFKSTRSNQASSCVEVRFEGGRVFVRDSKYLRDSTNDPSSQPVIVIDATDWRDFLAYVLDDAPAMPQLPVIDGSAATGATLRAHDGTILTFTSKEWAAFKEGVADREFDLLDAVA